MAADLFGGPLTVPAVARSLQDLLGNRVPARMTGSSLTLRAGPNNSGTVWLGLGDDLTTAANQIGFLQQGEYTTINVPAALLLGQLWLVGNGTDVVYLAGVCL